MLSDSQLQVPQQGTNFSFNDEKIGEMGVKVGDEDNGLEQIDQSGIVKAMKVLGEKQKDK